VNSERWYGKERDMKGGLGNLMKQAQLVQDNMKKLQEQLAVMEIEGQAASGKVRIVMTGRHEVKRVTIDPGLLSDDREMLEDLIAVAVNDAVRRVEAFTQEKMAGATAGLPLPPGLKLPF
jgi:nucleoid-associated protein EbfC